MSCGSSDFDKVTQKGYDRRGLVVVVQRRYGITFIIAMS